MKRASIITLGSMAVVVGLVVLYIFFRDQSVIQKNKETPAARALLPEPEQSFSTLTGEATTVTSSFGEVMVVTTWASWCPQCTNGFGTLGEIAAEFKESGVTVYAINRGEDMYSAERYLATIQKPGQVVFLLDESDYFFKNSDGYAMPETIVYNQSGDIVLQQRGELRADELRETLRSLTE